MDVSIINLMNTCFMVCLVFTILFFAISVLLFFVFDIRTIFSIKTGRAQAKTIKEMSKANASTGRLRVDGKTQTSKLSKEEISKGRAPAVIPPTQPELQNEYMGNSETSLLDNGAQSGMQNTTLLQPAETSVLNQTMTNDLPADETFDESARKINFRVVKDIMLVHTDITI